MLKREAAPLRTQLVNKLREDIISGRFGSGERLTEKALEAEYGVSRTVVREALRQLESERLVETIPNIGPQVRGLTYDDVVHLYQVRRALESAACGLAAQEATFEQIAKLRGAFEHLVLATKIAEVKDLIHEKNDLYEALVEASGNPIIGEMLSNVQARIAQMRFITLASDNRVPEMLSELRRTIEAIEASNPTAAVQAANDHVDAAARIALKHVAHLKHEKETAS